MEEEHDKNYKIATEAERLVSHIEENLEYDENGKSFIRKSKFTTFFLKFNSLVTKILSSLWD